MINLCEEYMIINELVFQLFGRFETFQNKKLGGHRWDSGRRMIWSWYTEVN